jgi:SAM-dependent methyltransferase
VENLNNPSALWSKNLEASRQRALTLLPRLESSDVLVDAGCNTGEMSRRAIKATGVSSAIGLEIDPSAASQANGEEVRVIVADLDSAIPLSSESVQAVFAHHVFAHLTRHDTFVKEVWRILCPGGTCVVSTENLSSWHNILALTMGFQDFSHNPSSVWYLGNPLSPHYRKKTPPTFSPHYKVFTPRSLRDIFEAYGFKVDKWLGTGYYPAPRRISRILESVDPWHSQFLTIRAVKPSRNDQTT